jgi:hypothetical protein
MARGFFENDMSSRDVRKARQSHGRNASSPALPMSAALEALGSHLRDRPRVKASAPAAPAPAPRAARTQPKAPQPRARQAIKVEGK